MTQVERTGGNPNVALVQRPLLPKAEALAPYLARIDANRWYSNRGSLLWELEERLQRHFGLDAHGVMLMASGSAALEVAILSHAGPGRADRPLALMPSFTFVATAQAAMRCGYRPYFIDVDPVTWMLDADALARRDLLEQAGVVIPVAAFGRRPDIAAWERFQAQTGRPVVIDAAAAFEQFERKAAHVSETVPAVLSLHTTKPFSTAEGGAILLNNPEAQLRAAQVSNFGQSDARQTHYDGLNAKLSEYHAAIGLAMLDDWPARKARFADLAAAYLNGAASFELPGGFRMGPDVASCYALLECRDAALADAVVARLAAARIGHRRWYGEGLRKEPLFAGLPTDAAPVSEDLGRRLIGLPAAIDLSREDIQEILAAVAG